MSGFLGVGFDAGETVGKKGIAGIIRNDFFFRNEGSLFGRLVGVILFCFWSLVGEHFRESSGNYCGREMRCNCVWCMVEGGGA